MLITLENTPTWVFVVFFVTLYYCFKARHRRDVDIHSFILLPCIFLSLSLWSIWHHPLPLTMSVYWLSSFIISALIIFKFTQKAAVSLGTKVKTINIPGTISVLIVFLLYFAVRYYLGYSEAMANPHSLSLMQLTILAIASGLSVGFYSGRALGFYMKYLRLAAQMLRG